MFACEVVNIIDTIVECRERVTQIQIEYEELRREKERIDVAVLEARSEKLQAETEQVLQDLKAHWMSWIPDES